METEAKDTKAFKDKNKKRAIIFLSVVLALLIILPIISFVDWDSLFKKEEELDKDSWIKFYGDQYFPEPNFDIVPEEDEKYMQLDRVMYYTEGNERFAIVEQTDDFGPCCSLFFDYFEKIKAGDFRTYYSLFTERYAEENGDINFLTKNKLIFTKQKIYAIEVSLLRKVFLEDGDANGQYVGSTVYYFDVSFKIKDNDGTFRRDVLSDEALPLVFEIIETNGVVRISDISFYKPA